MHAIIDSIYASSQLHEATSAWAKALNTALASTRKLPNLQRAGLPVEVVSWSVKEVAHWVSELGLAQWSTAFLAHRIQGDVMFSLKEETLKEMGVDRIGDRLYIVDCLQSLYEELTNWKKKLESRQFGTAGGTAASVSASGQQKVLAAPGGATGSGGGYGGATKAAQDALVDKLLRQGYSMADIMGLLRSRPEILAQLR